MFLTHQYWSQHWFVTSFSYLNYDEQSHHQTHVFSFFSLFRYWVVRLLWRCRWLPWRSCYDFYKATPCCSYACVGQQLGLIIGGDWSFCQVSIHHGFIIKASNLKDFTTRFQCFQNNMCDRWVDATFVELQVFKVWSPVHQATSLEDYHRVHSPVDGTIVSIRGYEKDELFPGSVVWLL